MEPKTLLDRAHNFRHAMPNLVKKKQQPQYPEQSRLRKLNVARHLHHIHVI